jgi:hypothetical protein
MTCSTHRVEPLFQGSTLKASSSSDMGLEACDEEKSINLSTPGVWYSYRGAGTRITVSTCFGQDFPEVPSESSAPGENELGRDGSSWSQAIGLLFGSSRTGSTLTSTFNTSGVDTVADCGDVSTSGSGMRFSEMERTFLHLLVTL